MKGLTRVSKVHHSAKFILLLLACCVLLTVSLSVVLAGPQGAQVVNGDVTIQQSGLNTNITASDRSIINYSSFDIARPEIVEFIQPSSRASVLNRILSASPTNINGTLLANGRVFFVNPAGIYFGNGARVNVNQLVASALNISDADFINGKCNFAGGNGPVVNNGDISAEKVYLIGKQVANSGTISCPAGYVVMAAGERVFLSEQGSGILLEVEPPTLPDPADSVGVLNEGTVNAAGGQIVLAAAGDIYSQAISNVGSLSVSVETGQAGEVKLVAADGLITNSGSIDATSASGTGGTVQVLGDKVGLLDAAEIDVSGSEGGGTVLVGGDYQGKGETPTASRTYVGPDATIKADATENGDGGKVIVWADEITAFYGDISARGGLEGGDGGFVEVSGKVNLDFHGYVDTHAPQGDTGTLLLDPTDLHIENGGAGEDDASLPDIFFAEAAAGGGEPADVGETDLEALNTDIILQATRDVIIEDLTTDGVLNLANLDTESIVIQAGRHITFNNTANTIQTAGGAIHLEADSPHTGAAGAGDGTGTLTLGNLTSGGGNITLIGADFIITGTVTAGVGNITVARSTDTDMTLGTGGQLVDAEIDNFSSSGVLKIGEADTKGTNGAGTGYDTLTATSITVASDITPSSAGTLHLKSSGTVTGTAGGIAVAGLAVEAAGAVVITDSTTDADTIAIDTSTGNIQYTDADGFSVGTVDGVSGVDTDSGSVTLIATTGNIELADIDNVVSAGGGGDVTLTATAGNITVADATTAVEIANTGSVTLTGAAIGATNWLDLDGAMALTISDLTGSTGHIQVREQTASTIANTTITAATATSGNLDIDYFGTDAVDIDNGHALTSVVLSDGGNFSYTATDGDITATLVNTGAGDITIDTDNGALSLVNLDTTTGNMDIDATGNITITADGGVTTTTGNVNINSSGGYIRNSGTSNGTADIITATGTITLEASTGIADSTGSAGLDTDSGGGAVTLTGDGTGNVLVDYVSTDADAVTLTATHTGTGNVTYNSLSTGVLTTAASTISNGNLSINATSSNINVSGAINATGGGVSLIAASGTIYTAGAGSGSDTLNVAITGSSDGTTGVDLPDGSGKAAIVIISKQQNLNLGENATLTAYGTYYWQDYDYDDRPSMWFAYGPPETDETGHPIDVAIYLGSYDYDSTTDTETGGNVTVNCSVDMADNGTMVVDAWDTVNLGDKFEASEPWSNEKPNGLELVSRRTGTIDEAIITNRLPYAFEARGHNPPPPPLFSDAGRGIDTYTLRGTQAVLAEGGAVVLASVGAAPIVAPVGVDLEDRREMEEDKDANLMQWLSKELGDAQIHLARAYQPSLNTDLRPYKAAAKLKDLTEILKDEGGLRVAALVEIVTKSLEKGPVTVEQIRENKAAGEWLDALAEYVSILNTEIGLAADESVNIAMKKYGSGLRPGGEQRVAEWVRRYVKPAGG